MQMRQVLRCFIGAAIGAFIAASPMLQPAAAQTQQLAPLPDKPFADHRIVLQLSDSDAKKEALVISVAYNLIKAYDPDKIAVEVVAFGPFMLDLSTRTLTKNGEAVSLTTGEFAVMKALVQHPREPLTRDKLMNLARGREWSAMERSIDVQVSRLRRLIEDDPSNARYIRTVWGVGYVFVPDGAAK